MAQGSPDQNRVNVTGLIQLLESLQRAGVAQLGKVPHIVLNQRPGAVAAPSAAASSMTAPSSREQAGSRSESASVANSASANPALNRPEAAASVPAQPVSSDMARRKASTPTSPGKTPVVATAPATLPVTPDAPPPALPRKERIAALEVLATEVAGCTRCRELSETRTQTVFGVGDPMARLCFCGEAPGGDEDRQGEPFVGRAGQLLTKIIEACTLRREDVYILNTLKCRPPNNRNPQPDETANCRGFFERQLDLIHPEYICCLGSFAAQGVLGTRLSIGRLRGRFHDFRGSKVICTYHPAYLLRNPSAKKDTWADMQMLMSAMGIELPG